MCVGGWVERYSDATAAAAAATTRGERTQFLLEWIKLVSAVGRLQINRFVIFYHANTKETPTHVI